MKGIGLVRFFTIALLLVCAYQLSFHFFTQGVESDAKAASKGDGIAEQRYLDSVATEPVVNLGFIKYTYEQAKAKQINLGLDLQGGMNVIMEVSLPDLLKALSNFSNDINFNRAVELAKTRQATSQKDYVTLFGEAWEEVSPNGSLAAIFATKENQGKVEFSSTNNQVLSFIRSEGEEAIVRSEKILRTRIDKFGVVQPNIQRQKGTGRIIIELPGVTNAERVRKLLVGTASLEFWETYENADIAGLIVAANPLVKAELDREKARKTGTTTASTEKAEVTPVDSMTAQADSVKDTSKNAAGGLLAKMGTDSSKKGDSKAKKDGLAANSDDEQPLFKIFGPALFQGKSGMDAQPGPVVGYALPKDTAMVNKYFSYPSVRASLPKDLRLVWSVKPINEDSRALMLVAIKNTRTGRPRLDGTAIATASNDVGQNGSNEISMSMTADGAREWRRMTGENVGKSIAIILDNNVYSYPNVNQEISGGRSSITGSFTAAEAKDLANLLQAGKLPAPARIVQEAIVGPSLGEQAIGAGLFSSIAGFIIIVITMGIYYRKAGLIANLALLANLFFIFGVLGSLQAVLTLPGIAGIVLTMATAVDANILIFERIKEEMRQGKGLREALTAGYHHAASAIIDSNLTTLAVGIILYIFGTGPIQGFATTLIIGICTSMFSAILISRLMFEWAIKKEIPLNFSAKFSQNAFQNIHIDWMGKRKIFYAISGAIILAGAVSFFVRGFSLGVDFSGGRSYVVELGKSYDPEEIRSKAIAAFDDNGKESSVEVKSYGTSTAFKVTTNFKAKEESIEASKATMDRLYQALSPLMTKKLSREQFESQAVLSSQQVGGSIADDIQSSATQSILAAIAIISVYILLRFRKWQYSVGAAVALLHDALLILAAFSLLHGILPFSMDIDQAFIAAILTVIGYSVLDTVVIFDRVREYRTTRTDDHSLELYNSAINSTLSRTILTSSLTISIVLILFIFGGDVIRGFSFALLFGLIAGSYSSVLIAVPVVYDLDKTGVLPGKETPGSTSMSSEVQRKAA